MKSEDYICSACYKLYLSILKVIQDQINSADNVLRHNVEFWRSRQCWIEIQVSRAVLKTVI